MGDDFTFRLFRVDQYVLRRKHEGDWQELIIREAINPEWHPQLKNIPKKVDPGTSLASDGTAENWEPLFTQVVKQDDGSVVVKQEFRDTKVHEEKQAVSAYMPQRWSAIAGEAYGSSLIEEAFGDVRAIDALAKALLDGTLLNAEYRWGVNPAGLTELQDLLDSVNGDFVAAGPNDVFPLQFQNAAQVEASLKAVMHREQQLGRRFLMNSAIQPKGERVTARQVSILAQELEGQLGGVLSASAREVQEPILRRTIFLMGKKNTVPTEVSEQIQKKGGLLKLRMRAGLEILNREAEREKLDAAIERMRNLPEAAQAVFKWTEIARDWWQSLGLETEGRIKTEEELELERQRRQQEQLAQQAALQGAQAGIAAAAQGDPNAPNA
jgi:hypothetical protein